MKKRLLVLIGITIGIVIATVIFSVLALSGCASTSSTSGKIIVQPDTGFTAMEGSSF